MQHLTGRVTKDAQIKTFESGRSVVNFNVVKNHYYKNNEGKRVARSQYFQCSFWRTTKIAPYITKGQIIELVGESQADVYNDKDGIAQPVMRLKVDQIIFHSAHKKTDSAEPEDNNTATGENDDLPF